MTEDYLTPELPRSVLLTIDLQRDFLDGAPFEIAGTTAVLPNVIRVLEAYRGAGLPIVHVVRLYVPGGEDVDLPRRSAVEGGLNIVAPHTTGSQLADGLLRAHVDLDSPALLRGALQSVGPSEWILYKPRWGAFYRTALNEFLSKRNISTVVVAGCNLPNCPRATLFEASERDYRTVVVEDAVSQVSDERLADLISIGVAQLRTADLVTSVFRLA
ncbi:MAG: isochorismatase family cysteine hydrolase [Actinomycetota bacterium]|nr:isochorismatase family cysteine hydrolase [Actinomycetota bacterium]MDP2286978.1 isochorismatase family cysteine hydrolase [Actinomycetota bacterium]